MRHPGVPEALRGTFAALAAPEVVDYLRASASRPSSCCRSTPSSTTGYLVEKGLTQLLGLQHDRLLRPGAALSRAGGRSTSSRSDGARLHAAGIEVILDVVYNHTAEGNELGPTLSFKGIDNASYYRLSPTTALLHQRHRHRQHRQPQPSARAADGDRLAALLGERDARGRLPLRPRDHPRARAHGFDEGGGFLDACRQDPVLSRVKLIAEPWDWGPGGYQVGSFRPAGRSGTTSSATPCALLARRRRPGAGTRARLPARATSSTAAAGALGERQLRHRHDGFTLNDLVSYDDKHNEANGEDNRDGHSDNLSCNHGVEGPTDDPGNHRALRERQKRNLLATLLFSQGTPMLLAGDEFGTRSTATTTPMPGQRDHWSWLDWAVASATAAERPHGAARVATRHAVRRRVRGRRGALQAVGAGPAGRLAGAGRRPTAADGARRRRLACRALRRPAAGHVLSLPAGQRRTSCRIRPRDSSHDDVHGWSEVVDRAPIAWCDPTGAAGRGTKPCSTSCTSAASRREGTFRCASRAGSHRCASSASRRSS
jgi:isoamylase